MKKLLSFSTALVLMLTGISTFSCGQKVDNVNEISDLSEISIPEPINAGAKVDVSSITGYYQMEEIAVPDDVFYVSDIYPLGNNEFRLYYESKNTRKMESYLIDGEVSNFSFFDYEIPEECLSADYYYALYDLESYQQGSILYQIEDHGGLKPPLEYDENFDYESYSGYCVKSYLLVNYENGSIVSSIPVDLPDMDSEQCYISYISELEDYLLLIENGNTLMRLNKSDGSIEKIYEKPDSSYSLLSMTKDRDGAYYIIIEDAESSEYDEYGGVTDVNCNLCQLNGDSLSEPVLTFKKNDWIPQPGYGKYKFLINDGEKNALYGICDDGSREEIINWEKSDLSMINVCPIGNGEFFGVLNVDAYDDIQSRFVKLVPGDVNALGEKTEITLAVVMHDEYAVTKDVFDFNLSNDKYHIKTVVYGDNSPENEMNENAWAEAYSQLIDDINNGNAPDIIYSLNYGDYIRLAEKGKFADMDQFLDGRSGYTKDDIFRSIIKSMAVSDGKMYAMPLSFRCESMVVKNKFWDKPTWTMDEMLNFFDNAPESAVFMYDDEISYDMLEGMTESDYGLIDYSNGECHFDSEDFIKRLEFCNRFLLNDTDQPEKDYGYPWHSQEYYDDRESWFGTDRTLVIRDNISTWINYTKFFRGNGEEINFVGYPTEEGENGGLIIPSSFFCINSSCQDKEGAWEFILKEMNSDDVEYSSLKPKTKELLYREIGTEHTSCGRKIPTLTQEQADMIMDYLDKCSNVSVGIDPDIQTVIYEEGDKYFAGECSANEAAYAMQKRVSEIMERYK